jgi:hypothetical protein
MTDVSATLSRVQAVFAIPEIGLPPLNEIAVPGMEPDSKFIWVLPLQPGSCSPRLKIERGAPLTISATCPEKGRERGSPGRSFAGANGLHFNCVRVPPLHTAICPLELADWKI